MNTNTNTFTELDIFARTLYGEARGDVAKFGDKALYAIGHVILNRLEAKSWFGTSIKAVCLKPFQFSCWNKDDPNYPILMQTDIKNSVYALCETVAQDLLKQKNKRQDFTNGANHYHHRLTAAYWSHKKTPTLTFGSHMFYKI